MRISDWSSDVCSSDLAILAKAMSEESLKQVAAIISAKKVSLTPEEARELAKRALKFKQERGRLPSITSPDAWEKRMAEGVAFLERMKAEAANGSSAIGRAHVRTQVNNAHLVRTPTIEKNKQKLKQHN